MNKRKTIDEATARDHQIYRLKISLRYIQPPIWRRLEVSAGMDMESLATAIDTIFGWSGDHMGEFDIKGRRVGDGTHWLVEEDPRTQAKEFRQRAKLLLGAGQKKPATLELFSLLKAATPELPARAEDSGELDVPALWELIPRARTKFIYLYDFGDNWEHVIEVEKILEAEAGVGYPRCTGGARADPMEDCGGVWGHQELVEAAGNPKHERYADLEEWGMEKWDPEHFSTEETDRKLAKVFRRKK